MKAIRRFSLKTRRMCIGLTLATLLAVVLARCWYSKPQPSYLTTPAVRADIEHTVQAIGTLRAFKQVDVGAQVSGQVRTLHVQLGDAVKKGQALAEIDPVLAENELRKQQMSAEALVVQKRAARAQAHQAKLAWQRQQHMLVEDATAHQEVESAEAAFKAKQAELEQLEVHIKQARIQLETARTNLNYTHIVAPIDGEVVSIHAQEGQTVIAQQQAPLIMKLAALSTMTIEAQISEADVVRVHPGQKVYFTILGAPDQRYYSTLRAIEPAPPQSSQGQAQQAVFYNALFEVPNPQRLLRVGMTAQVSIVLDKAQAALVIPVSALGERLPDGRVRVRVLKADGTVQSRAVRTGINNRVQVQILSDLKEGEQVILGTRSAPEKEEALRPRRGRRHL